MKSREDKDKNTKEREEKCSAITFFQNYGNSCSCISDYCDCVIKKEFFVCVRKAFENYERQNNANAKRDDIEYGYIFHCD